MITRIKPRAVLDLARSDVPSPVDVVNLITPSRFDRYRWYALLVMPVLTAVGGRVLWMGRHDRALSGDFQADKLLVVRYPSHRRFLAMTLNPYYAAINLFREAGVERFEASFTHASHTDPDLMRRRLLVGVHYAAGAGAAGLGRVSEVLGSAGCELVYATEVTTNVRLLDPPRPTDPNPLSLGALALFAPADDELPEADVRGLADRLAAVTDEFSLQVYRREPRGEYLPSRPPLPRLTPRAASAAGD